MIKPGIDRFLYSSFCLFIYSWAFFNLCMVVYEFKFLFYSDGIFSFADFLQKFLFISLRFFLFRMVRA